MIWFLIAKDKNKPFKTCFHPVFISKKSPGTGPLLPKSITQWKDGKVRNPWAEFWSWCCNWLLKPQDHLLNLSDFQVLHHKIALFFSFLFPLPPFLPFFLFPLFFPLTQVYRTSLFSRREQQQQKNETLKQQHKAIVIKRTHKKEWTPYAFVKH